MASELDRLRVLLIEDNLADARLTRELLNEANPGGFDLVHAATLQHGIDALATAEFGIVLLDLSLIDAQGLDTVRRLRQQHPRVPIIVVSGLDDEEVALEALHNGAQDYLVKGQGDGHLIARAMRYAIERKRTELQLIEARDLAEAASQAKSAFLANMSHELRTPLNAIIGFSEIIAGELFGAEASGLYRQYAGHINGSGQHLLKLVNEVLDVSKFVAGQLDLEEVPVDLAELLHECVDLMELQLGEKRLALCLAVPEDLALLTADPLRLKQVLLNLLSNSVKFSKPDTAVEIAVALTQEGDLTVAITDHGIGMRAEDIPTALEPFRQINRKPGQAQEGTGLGLPLAKMMVEKHGGALSLTSVPGEGTTVCVTIPGWRINWVGASEALQRA
jgi:signal transduction histidine kinase